MPVLGDHASTGPNADEIAYWNNDAGRRWVALQDRIDALFAPLTESAIDHAAPRRGEYVLDIGCGCGASVLELAKACPEGRVVGVDVSEVMLDVARRRVEAAGCANATLILADASAHRFEPTAFSLAFSRFGVMFFSDPVAAFLNIRRGLATGSRLAFVAWRRLSDNPWFLVPFIAAKPHLPPQPSADPEAPGPFAFADPDRVRRIVEGAGFSSVELVRHDTTLQLGGRNELDRVVDFATQIGPVSRSLAAADGSQRAVAEAAVREALARHETDEGIRLGAGVWLVSARA